MRAIVCDCCGKTVLLDDDRHYAEPTGMHHLTGDILGRSHLDLCDECAEKLIAAVRETEGNHATD